MAQVHPFESRPDVCKAQKEIMNFIRDQTICIRQWRDSTFNQPHGIIPPLVFTNTAMLALVSAIHCCPMCAVGYYVCVCVYVCVRIVVYRQCVLWDTASLCILYINWREFLNVIWRG